MEMSDAIGSDCPLLPICHTATNTEQTISGKGSTSTAMPLTSACYGPTEGSQKDTN